MEHGQVSARAEAAEIERLRAKLREAMEEIEQLREDFSECYADLGSTMTKLGEAVEVMKGTLATLVAITSLVIRAEDAKRQPSKVVASDAMFRQMLVDYENATIAIRAFLATIEKS